ncbi:MAG: Zn-dependent hydrolase [Spirochaetota bacterium]
MTAPKGPLEGAAVTAARIRELFDTIGAIGRTSDGGCHRPAFSAAERSARMALVDAGRGLGLAAARDRMGSVFLVRPGRESTLPAVFTGSHLDTVPRGGCFDGAAGVLCGLAAVELLDRVGIETRRPVVVVSWANEEGARFSPATMGSGVFTGALAYERAVEATDAEGVRLEQELLRETLPETPCEELPEPGVYLELHPEQGRVLENAGASIGVVAGVQGQVSGDWVIQGRADHAGTTPMYDRADALVAASNLIAEIPRLAAAESPGVATVGEVRVEPGARNVVPGRVHGTLDIRHPEDDAVERLLGAVLSGGARIAEGAGCTFTWEEAWRSPSVRFDEGVLAAVADCAAHRHVPSVRLTSGAGHDAVHMSSRCPSGMIFVPSRDGISHSPSEYTSYADLAAGATVLAEALITLASQ